MNHPRGEVQRLATAILRRIVGGAYPAGLRLPAETDLAAEFDCGRSTVREALRHLAGMGLVRSRRGSGAMVLDFRKEGTPALLPAFLEAGNFDHPPAIMAAELLRIRTQMACQAVRLAAKYAGPEDLTEARACLSAAPSLESAPVDHAANELELYRSLVAASGIWPAVWLVNSFWGPLGDVHRLLAPVMGPVRPDFQPTMEKLLALIGEGDDVGAEQVVRDWFASVDRDLVAVLGEVVAAVGTSQRSPHATGNGPDRTPSTKPP
jgi:DNA-binding FadR family transcriptional regulator